MKVNEAPAWSDLHPTESEKSFSESEPEITLIADKGKPMKVEIVFKDFKVGRYAARGETTVSPVNVTENYAR